MPSYIITVKPQTTDSELARIKQEIEAQKGKITHDYPLFRGFACSLPQEHYSTFASHPHVENMELDGVVTTQ